MLLGVTLFSLILLFYAIIGIGRIGIAAKTHYVLTAKGQTAESLQQHIPIMVLSCPMDWIPYDMRIRNKVTLIDTSDKAHP